MMGKCRFRDVACCRRILAKWQAGGNGGLGGGGGAGAGPVSVGGACVKRDRPTRSLVCCSVAEYMTF